MDEQRTNDCPVCHKPMMDSEFGPMCRRALQSWKCVDERWKRSFAGHPEVNPAEREYLEKFGIPRDPEAAALG
jgi:hypothetical protein